MDTYFAREAEIIDIVYDLDTDYIVIFTFDRNIYLIVLIKCEIIILYVTLASIYILVIHIRKY